MCVCVAGFERERDTADTAAARAPGTGCAGPVPAQSLPLCPGLTWVSVLQQIRHLRGQNPDHLPRSPWAGSNDPPTRTGISSASTTLGPRSELLNPDRSPEVLSSLLYRCGARGRGPCPETDGWASTPIPDQHHTAVSLPPLPPQPPPPAPLQAVFPPPTPPAVSPTPDPASWVLG